MNYQNDSNLNFTHLHVHTEYSLLDGSAKIKELVQKAKDLGMDSLAITDHGAMFGAIDFYKAAKEVGIKPIIGCEVYVAPGSRFVKDQSKGHNYNHLVLLAESNEGYQNLIKLVSCGYTEGFYYKPRIDMELLRQYNKGIIATSACLAGVVARELTQKGYERGKEVALEYEEIFGKGNFFLEMQDHGISEQKIVNEHLLKMSKETGIPLIATNDSHYINKEDAEPHDILLCIQTGKTVNDEDRMKYEGDQFYLKSPKEMHELFHYAPYAMENAHKIGQRCNVEFEFHDLKLPKFDVPQGKTTASYLREVCYQGFNKNYPNADEALIERIEYELTTIEQMGYIDYFLIVWDFIKYAKDNGISVGPGRGSAAGSIVSYCLSITTIDPIKYNLIFERFLNPERVSMPDIDIDFCYERRQEVIDYVVKKYGDDHVSQIITFGTLAARASIKDVGRALAMPYAEVDKVSKMIPFELGITIGKAIKMNPELKNYYEEDERIKYLVDMSRKLEGLPRHSSTHAAGVVICKEPVVNYVPLSTNDGAVTTQYSMTTLEELGLLKMDFLGLRTLTVIQDTVKEIKRIYGIDIDVDNLPDNDLKVYDLISKGKTEGLFQLESAGMKSFMKELAPSRLEDLIAGISLYRPGPMDFIPKYVKGKNTANAIQYTHSSLEPILNNTYGCIVYQEQVMQIVRDLAGYSLGRSDILRRAMSKKKASVMAEERKNFVYGIGEDVPGCVKNGIPAEIAEKIFDEMTDFAKYAFNKSHAACYAVVGYQTAWLKTNYPVEFMAALMTSVMDNTTKISLYIEECKRMNIKLLPPDINEGYLRFSVSEGGIRFGLAAIKSVGRSTITAIVKEREENGVYKSLTDFLKRIGTKEMNKRAIESFIKAGVFDSFGGARSQYVSVYKGVFDGIINEKRNNIEGQIDLFALAMGDTESTTSIIDSFAHVDEYPEKVKLAYEKEVLGIYVSGHPLAEHEKQLKRKTSCISTDLIFDENIDEMKVKHGDTVKYGGIIGYKKIQFTKRNEIMAFLRLEDMYGAIKIIIFPNTYEKYQDILTEDNIVIIEGEAQISEDDESCIVAKKILPLEQEEETAILFLKAETAENLNKIGDILEKYKGNIPVKIRNAETGELLVAKKENWVAESGELFNHLVSLLGKDNVVLKKK